MLVITTVTLTPGKLLYLLCPIRSVQHICFRCVSKLTIIVSGNGLAPGRCQAIIWTNIGMLLIGPLGTNFSEILIEIYTFSFRKMHLKMSTVKCRPFCLGLNVLKTLHDAVRIMGSIWPNSARCQPILGASHQICPHRAHYDIACFRSACKTGLSRAI